MLKYNHLFTGHTIIYSNIRDNPIHPTSWDTSVGYLVKNMADAQRTIKEKTYSMFHNSHSLARTGSGNVPFPVLSNTDKRKKMADHEVVY